MIRFTVLGSGSTGNAVLLEAEGTRVLIDAGLSARELLRRCALAGVSPESIGAILISHEHGDHAGGLRVALGKLSCPVYISSQCREAYIKEKYGRGAPEEARKREAALAGRVAEIVPGRDFRVGRIDFRSFLLPHDAVENMGFVAECRGVRVASLMDFGHVSPTVVRELRGAAAVIIESNHEVEMLRLCEVYPFELKQRIASDTGHLSNEAVADWLGDGFDGQADHIVLTHLSQRCNDPSLAELIARQALRRRFGDVRLPSVTISHHKVPTPWIEV